MAKRAAVPHELWCGKRWQGTETGGGFAYRVRIKFRLRIILTSDTYSDDWAFRQHPLNRLSSSADHDNLPESDTGPFYSALASH
jgi:hypothetical protein